MSENLKGWLTLVMLIVALGIVGHLETLLRCKHEDHRRSLPHPCQV